MRLGSFIFEGVRFPVHYRKRERAHRHDRVEYAMKGFADALTLLLREERGAGRVVRVGLRTFAWRAEQVVTVTT